MIMSRQFILSRQISLSQMGYNLPSVGNFVASSLGWAWGGTALLLHRRPHPLTPTLHTPRSVPDVAFLPSRPSWASLPRRSPACSWLSCPDCEPQGLCLPFSAGAQGVCDRGPGQDGSAQTLGCPCALPKAGGGTQEDTGS